MYDARASTKAGAPVDLAPVEIAEAGHLATPAPIGRARVDPTARDDRHCPAGAGQCRRRLARGRPALVARDVVLGDQGRGHQDHRVVRLLAVHEVVADLNGLLRHAVGVLAGRGLDQRVAALERLLDIRGTVDRRNEEIFTVHLPSGQISTGRLRVTDREYRVDLRKPGEIALHDVHAPLAGALAVLIVRQDLDLRILGQGLPAAAHPVDHRRGLRAVLDDDLATVRTQLVDDVLTR